MAAAFPSPPASPRRLDDLLLCPVCLESFKDPKTLSCLHSFCTGCLEHCRRPYRRDISCPVCKKVTSLSPLGVSGLQHDFRIQQIKDILLNAGPDTDSTENSSEGLNTKVCDLCKTQQRINSACHHCIQCYMYFCVSCLGKHNANQLFSSHHVINMGESNATEVLFCRTHREHPVRYFCKPCSLMLCTICTMEHESSHSPEPLERGIIEKYRSELQQSLKTIKSKLSEIKTKAKYLETIKEAHQKALYDAQAAIKQKTAKIVHKIKQQETKLLDEVQSKIDDRMKETGIDSLTDMKFYSSNIESLYSEIETVVHGSPQQCLVAYDELISRMRNLPDAPQMTSQRALGGSVLRFVPAQDDDVIERLIGTLHECALKDKTEVKDAASGATGGLGSGAVSTATSPAPSRRRTSSILHALTPSRKSEAKKHKIKGPTSPDVKSSAPVLRSKINADDLLRGSSGDARPRQVTCSPAASGDARPRQVTCSPAASADDQRASCSKSLSKPRLVFKVDQVGG